MKPWPRQFSAATADRLILCISDIEMGAGGPHDDFPHSDFLGELILSYNEPPFDQLAIDLVLNGDVFDLLKTTHLGKHSTQISADVGLGKMSRVAAAHPLFFEAIRNFVAHESAPRDVHFLVGNHDFEILFPEVQGFVRSLCGGSDRIHFPGFRLGLGRVLIEHGSQADVLFRIDEDKPFLEVEGKRVLNLPFGSVGLLDVVMAWQPLLHFYDRLAPRNEILDLVPEFKQLYAAAFWNYWTRDFWKGFFTDRDPMKRLSWTIAKEVASRLVTKDADVALNKETTERMQKSTDYDVYLMGHLHEATWLSYGSRKTLITGCMRNEYMILDEGRALQPIPKSYAEIFMQGDRPVRSHLVELDGPPPPEGYIPDSIFDVVPKLRELLASVEEQKKDSKAQKEQEAKEARADHPADIEEEVGS